MAELLKEAEIKERLTKLSDRQLEENTIKCTRTFKDFIAAINFINNLVQPAESAGHHPDLQISYNKVTISLTTHDAGGLTEKDFEMAKIISQLS